MVDKTQNWSKSWKNSTDPAKQRKYTQNAPKHIQDKLIKTRVHKEIKEELGTKTIPIKRGDRAQVMTGTHEGREGIVSEIDRDKQKVYLNEITTERVDGTQKMIPIDNSNLQIEALNIEDLQRLEKYEYEEEALDKIEVEEEELEELEEQEEQNEMMEQMQQGESGAHEQYEDDEEISEEEAEELAEEIEQAEEEIEKVEEDMEDLEEEIEENQQENNEEGDKKE